MNHIDELYRVFLGKILNEVAQECDSFKEVTNGTLAHFDGVPYEFCLVSFFECVWVRAAQLGLDLPSESDFQKDFDQFRHCLMQPWPMEKIQKCGLTFKRVGTTKIKIKQRFKIERI